MNENYIDILIQNLRQKSSVLDLIIGENIKQKEVLSSENEDMDAFDVTVENKTALIERIAMLDNGFNSVYERVEEMLSNNRELYRKEILEMQDLIKVITEKSITIQKQEADNKNLAERQFVASRKRIKQMRVTNQAATKYYSSMNKLNLVDPQFMDKKK